MELIYIPLMGALDRLRGNKWPEGTGALKKLMIGLAMSFAMGFEGIPLAISTFLCAASFANGWGSPLGAALGKHYNMHRPFEKWQVDWFGNILREDPYVAMAFRGIIAGLYLLPLCYWNPVVVVMLPLLAICYSIPTLCTNNWETYEFIRGCSIGLSCLLIKLW